MCTWPEMTRVHQICKSPVVQDVRRCLLSELSDCAEMRSIRPGAQVAIAVGSRGIAEIVTIVRTLVDALRAIDARPFVVPAMGSQGGATAEGQADVLKHLGITEARIGAPVKSADDVVCVGRTIDGVSVYCDKLAASADALVCVNRIKPHTAFRADIESGLMKLLAVGLGKRWSAEAVHSAPGGLARGIVQGARVLMQRTALKFGIAVVETASHGIARLAVLAPHEFEQTERRLLSEARAMMGTLPVDELDVLIVDEIGKNISGACMDPNVIGMARRLSEMSDSPPHINRVVALGLTEESQGNAEGIGLADITTKRLVDRIDFRKTYINCITSGFLRGAMVPLTCDTDREAIRVSLHGFHPDRVRIVRIRNTRDLNELDVSESILGEVLRTPGVRQVGLARPFEFTSAGRLVWQPDTAQTEFA